MSDENYNAVPTPFRGLRVLLVDNDTSSMLNIANELEKFSYRVTTTELATVALSILQERKDCFDLIMADINMPEMDIFKFINNVQLIKDLPTILMSRELNKDMVKEAMIKGACFFLEKPISSKNLKNVWQHVCRQSKNISGTKAVNKRISDQQADSKGADEIGNDNKALEIVDERPFQESESDHVGDSDQIEDYQDDRLTRIGTKRSMMTESDERGNSKKLKSLAGNERKMENKELGFLERQSRLQWAQRFQKYRIESSATELNRAKFPTSDRTEISETPSMDEIQVSTRPNQSLSNYFEVTSRKKRPQP